MIFVPEKLIHWQINPSKYITNMVKWQKLTGSYVAFNWVHSKSIWEISTISYIYIIRFGFVLCNQWHSTPVCSRDTCLDNDQFSSTISKCYSKAMFPGSKNRKRWFRFGAIACFTTKMSLRYRRLTWWNLLIFSNKSFVFRKNRKENILLIAAKYFLFFLSLYESLCGIFRFDLITP